MNIGSSTCSDCAAHVQSAQGLAVMKQAMNQQKLEGQAALKLIDTASRPANPAGVGERVDVSA